MKKDGALFAGTRIASVKPSWTLYYYRTRLGTVIGTSLGGGVPGAGYRYTPYGEVERYETYDYPEPGEGKRVDVVGRAHGGVPTPHVVDTKKHVNPETGVGGFRFRSGVTP